MKKKLKKFTDTQRLNWLQKAVLNINVKGFRAGFHSAWETTCGDNDDSFPCFRSIRSAIDHAMREEAE